ncbi:MAG: Lrp/AsnC family transcriptional regulator [Candidatus Poseidoniales archaeon]|nr:MAG: Lrp/AsnC family transcriptional regulator [Candidatus Poseidoniales archaeon]
MMAPARAWLMHDLDATDRAILGALLEDARYSQREIAKRVGVAQGTVTNRLRRMEDAGIIVGHQVRLDAERLGWEMTVIAGLRIAKGNMMEVQRAIAKDPRVFAVYDVTGDYDSMVLARVKNRADLDDLTKTVLTSDHVTRSYTHVVLNTVKEEGVALPPFDPEDLDQA